MKKVTAIAAILAFATLLAGVVLAKDYDQPTPSIIQPTDEQSSAPEGNPVMQDQPQTQEEQAQMDQLRSEEKVPDSSPSDDDK
jgi:hypothetical protein